MAIKHENNYESTLQAAIDNVQTSITVSSDAGFPPIGVSDVCTLTIDNGIDLEIVLVTSKSGTTLTVVRGYEGTTPAAFSAGTKIENRLTADTIDDKLSRSDDLQDDGTFSSPTSDTVASTSSIKTYVDTEDASTLSSANTYTDNKAAGQTTMEAASSTTTYVTPGNMEHHPGMPKAWVKFSVVAGVLSILTSYNVSSVNRTATGLYTITFTTPFSNNNYLVQGFAQQNGTRSIILNYQTGTMQMNNMCFISAEKDDSNVEDAPIADLFFYGDQ